MSTQAKPWVADFQKKTNGIEEIMICYVSRIFDI